MEEVQEVASAAAAAEKGVDIIEAVNSAVEVALKTAEETLDTVIDALNRFLWKARDERLDLLFQKFPNAEGSFVCPSYAFSDFFLHF
jgi:hypothetical protein